MNFDQIVEFDLLPGRHIGYLFVKLHPEIFSVTKWGGGGTGMKLILKVRTLLLWQLKVSIDFK